MTVTYTIYVRAAHTTYASFFARYKVPLKIKDKWIDDWRPADASDKGWKVVFSSLPLDRDKRFGRMYIVEKGSHVLIVNERAFMGIDPLDVNSEMRDIWK